MDEKVYWLGFNLVKGIGAVRFQNLINFFGSLEVAWQAPVDALASAGLSQKIIENLVLVRTKINLQKFWDRLQLQGIQVLTWQEEAYPSALKEIDQPPPVLYVPRRLHARRQLVSGDSGYAPHHAVWAAGSG